MSDDLQTNTRIGILNYQTLSKVNIITDSYNDVLTLGLKDITRALNVNIISRMNIFLNDNGINNHLTLDVETPSQKTIKKIHVSIPYKAIPFKVSQKMHYMHSTTLNSSLSSLDDELYLNTFIDFKNPIDVNILNTAKFLSKKYAHNEYSYCKYFFDKLKIKAYQFNGIKYRQSMNYTTFMIKTLDNNFASLMNVKVDMYNDLYIKMHKIQVRYFIKKHKLNGLKVVQQWKHFKNLVAEYKKSIADIDFKIATYDNVNVEYQNTLKESISYLLVDALANLKIAEVEMATNPKYIKEVDKISVLKDSYKAALRLVIDYRKNFKEYMIFKKVAAYKYIGVDGSTCINGIKWSLKNPSGKLNSKTSLSSLQKAYNKVTFDKTTKKLTVNSGL